MSLFTELKRRNVFRVGTAYIVVAWLVIQVVETIFPAFGFGDSAVRVVAILFAIGLVPAFVLSWIFEFTPEGLKREDEVDRSQAISSYASKKLDRAIIVILTLAVGYFAVDKFVLDPARDTEIEKRAAQRGRSETLTSSFGQNSIAVLPFVNMSDDASNEYFADGLSEELINLLVKLPTLKVAARTSSFSYKGKDTKIAQIGEELNVAHVLEGSVRKAGSRVRITAQLIKADDGFRLWSATYDRTLDDIFVIQDEIASTVSRELKLTLLGAPPASRPTDPEVYELYLQGKYFLNLKTKQHRKKAVSAFQQVLDHDPEYAPAWSDLAFAYHYQTTTGVRPREEGVSLAMEAIDQALAHDPELGHAWSVYAFLKKYWEWDWETAEAATRKALQLDPYDAEVVIGAASMATTLGQLDAAIGLYEQAYSVDPLNLGGLSALGQAYMRARRFDDAISTFGKLVALAPDYFWGYSNLGKAYLLRGDAERALIEIANNPEGAFQDLETIMAFSTLGREEEAQEMIAQWKAKYGDAAPTRVAEIYGWRGENDLAFEWLEKALTARDGGLSYTLGNVAFANLVGDPRWPVFLQKLDLLEAWKAMPPELGGPPNSPTLNDR